MQHQGMCTVGVWLLVALSSLVCECAPAQAAVAEDLAPRSASAPAGRDAKQSGEHETRIRKGREVASLMLSGVNFTGFMRQAIGAQSSPFANEGLAKARPDWPRLFDESVLESAPTMKAMMIELIGNAWAAELSMEDLDAGIAILSGPDGRALAAALGAATESGAPSEADEERVTRAVGALTHTTAGLTWLKRLGEIDVAMEAQQDEFVARLFLDVFSRFTEKANAAEQR
jgi:hypothetical protein